MFKLVWDKAIIEKLAVKLDSDIEAAAELVAEEARSLVPVETGALRDSIRVKKSKFKNGGYLITAGGPGAKHVNLVELGTYKMDKKPFLRPALHNKEAQIRRMIKL